MTFFDKIMVAEKNNFSSNAEHNFAKGKVISKCKDVIKIYFPPSPLKKGEGVRTMRIGL